MVPAQLMARTAPSGVISWLFVGEGSHRATASVEWVGGERQAVTFVTSGRAKRSDILSIETDNGVDHARETPDRSGQGAGSAGESVERAPSSLAGAHWRIALPDLIEARREGRRRCHEPESDRTRPNELRWNPRETTMRYPMILACAMMLTAAAPASAADDGPEMAVRDFIEAVRTNDADALTRILAPEFQIARADGSGHVRDGYLTSTRPVISSQPKLEAITVTEAGDTAVIRYTLVVDETLHGVKAAREAPRLTVARMDGDTWRIVAHSNFAASKR